MFHQLSRRRPQGDATHGDPASLNTIQNKNSQFILKLCIQELRYGFNSNCYVYYYCFSEHLGCSFRMTFQHLLTSWGCLHSPPFQAMATCILALMFKGFFSTPAENKCQWRFRGRQYAPIGKRSKVHTLLGALQTSVIDSILQAAVRLFLKIQVLCKKKKSVYWMQTCSLVSWSSHAQSLRIHH